MIDLHVPPAPEYASLVASVVDDAARRAELADEQRNALVRAARLGFELIVQEAMCTQREPIRLHARWTPAELRVSLLERGLPLDDARAPRDPRWQDITSHVDRAHWQMHSAGSELQLSVKRPHGATHDAAIPPLDTPLAPQQSYTIRRFQPEDAPGVARAFYLTWGYHYIFPAVYVPRRLTELNRTNAYISIVAVAENGEIVGHYALDPVPGAPIADCCAAVVVPAHRGRGLLERMRSATEQEAIRLGFAAYYSEPVTTHGRTQSESAKFGAHLCAIVLGGDPATFVPKAMEFTGAGQRQSYTVFFKPLRTREPRAIYAPVQHREMIETIYASLDLPIELRDGSPPTGDGELRVEIVRAEGFATIDAPSIGSNSIERIAQAVSDLKELRRIGAIYANVPLEDAAAPALCDALERLGFFFCGVVPWGLAGRDALRLQLPLTPIDLSKVTIVGEFGERFKAYIGGLMPDIATSLGQADRLK